jgi:3'-phosphoadenosine 5'-phosphosulfate sulfotransferase (PAPS reductase)/FAD synthetase
MNNILLPEAVAGALQRGAPLLVHCSGGKDSDAMLLAVSAARARCGWPGRFLVVHCDLGRMEWPQSLPHTEQMAAAVGAEMVVLRREFDLLEGIERRRDKMRADGKSGPFWPDARSRYCTSDWKRDVTDRWIRQQWPRDAEVINAIGLRAEESAARKRRAVVVSRNSCAPSYGRQVNDWLPIHHWTEPEVWAQLGVSMAYLAWVRQQVRDGQTPDALGWTWHPAYAYGNQRVSCMLCVLANRNDHRNGAAHNPALYRHLVDLELESGYSFQNGRWLADLSPDLLRPDQRTRRDVMKTEATPVLI